MENPIKLPVTVNADAAIIDAAGRVVANFCWLGDYVHVKTGMAKALFVADLINNCPNEPVVGPAPQEALAPGNGHATKETNAFVVGIAQDLIEGAKKKRMGNPLFRKGFPNPYGKKKEGDNDQKPAA